MYHMLLTFGSIIISIKMNYNNEKCASNRMEVEPFNVYRLLVSTCMKRYL